ncbi:MAG: chorismate lyase [Pseudomonadota bacterium]|nr:chorismate lyase [Gammaproteobacteria bacterium]MBU1731210.1 chorismate lyase [Gammaproteobacteria bacterium]MBU1892715.1 chorismate lyase [Gammaproteobacteria bacterium]
MRHLPLLWQPRPPAVHCPYRPWLVDRGSLTHRIQMRCNAFSVRGLRLALGRPGRDEAASVNLNPRNFALLREVHLYCSETPVVFAHSVIPRAGLRGPWQALSKLGSKPLGAALFTNPRVQRKPLEFKKLNRRHELYRRACRILKERPAHLWARRSVFVLGRYPILVTEVFLPGILELTP